MQMAATNINSTQTKANQKKPWKRRNMRCSPDLLSYSEKPFTVMSTPICHAHDIRRPPSQAGLHRNRNRNQEQQQQQQHQNRHQRINASMHSGSRVFFSLIAFGHSFGALMTCDIERCWHFSWWIQSCNLPSQLAIQRKFMEIRNWFTQKQS